MKKENRFQSELISDIEKMFPGCMVLKNDTQYIQGIPDLTILYENKWAALECKRSRDASFRPNQREYIEQLNKMSYCSAVYPENKEEVLNELQSTFRT